MNFNFTRCVSVAFSFVLVCASPDLASAKSERAAADDSARHTNQGVKFARDKQYEKTITEFSKAIEQEPNDPKNYENRAGLPVDRQTRTGAWRFDEADRTSPKDAKAYSSKGEIEVQQGKLDTAINDLTRATELDPGDANIRRYRGYAFLQK